jgi:predicted metalloprotease
VDFDEGDQADLGQLEDRRGSGGGLGGLRGGPIAVGAGGLGIVGLVITLLLSFLGQGGGGIPGFDPNSVSNIDATGSNAPPPTEIATSCAGATSATDNATFIACANTNIQTFWTKLFEASGQQYSETTLVLFTQGTQSGCGQASSSTGPFYCPLDRKVYIDLDFYRVLRERFRAPGEFAQAYVIAHEIGHHVQTLLGVAGKVQARKQQYLRVGDEPRANALQVRMELQADCLAGVWANRTDQMKRRLEPGDIESGLNAASAIGDDTLQRRSQGQVVPESFTHGSSAQRVRWFKRGIESGDLGQCNTFEARHP